MPGAGNARRSEDADHPRLLRAAAAAVSVRGECRGALPGARRRAATANCWNDCGSACCSKPPPSRTARRRRALAAAITAASDFAFKDALTEAIGKRDEVMAFVATGRRRSRGSPRSSRAPWAWALSIRSSGSRLKLSMARICRRPRGRDRGRSARPGSSSDEKQCCTAVRGRCRMPVSERVDAYLSVFMTDERRTAQTLITGDSGDASIRTCRLDSARSRRGFSPLIERRRAVRRARPHRALFTIATRSSSATAPRRIARGLLDYDDLIDKTRAPAGPGRCRLGALQARSRHRSSADRRGAGYQPGAVGHRQPAGLGVHRRRRRARHAGALDLRGRRREAVDLLVPGRGAGSIRRDGPAVRACSRGRQPAFPADRVQTFVSLGRRSCSMRSTWCSGSRRPMPACSSDEVADGAHGSADAGARIGRDLGRWSSPMRSPRSKPGTRRSTPRRRRARAPSSRA